MSDTTISPPDGDQDAERGHLRSPVPLPFVPNCITYVKLASKIWTRWLLRSATANRLPFGDHSAA